MFQRDYLMKMIFDLVAGIRRSMERAGADQDPSAAAHLLEITIGESVDMDGETLLSFSPDSMASILEISGTDPQVTEYLARSLALTGHYYEQAGQHELGRLRKSQAESIARVFGHRLVVEEITPEEMEEFLGDQEKLLESL